MATRKLTVGDLVEEAKKRVVLLFICVIGLSYLMSLTSSSVWINMPAAAVVIILIRYISYDLENRGKLSGGAAKLVPSTNKTFQKKAVEDSNQNSAHEASCWKIKVDSPVVEAAIDQFTRHIVSEWVTDLWYSRITPDSDGPEELVNIMNGVIGEVSLRLRDINLIDLLTRDIINLLCENLEVYRTGQAKIGKHELEKLTVDERDRRLKLVLGAENKLHPALFSPEAEHKVLQHLMDGLISFTCKPEDLKCNFFRYMARELLACAVIRPVLNLANPRQLLFADIPSLPYLETLLELSLCNSIQTSPIPVQVQFQTIDEVGLFSEILPSFSKFIKASFDAGGTNTNIVNRKTNGVGSDAYSSSYRNPIQSDSHIAGSKKIQTHGSRGEWGQMLDMMHRRKTQALAPEHFDNMWTKGRNYKKKDTTNQFSVHAAQKHSVGNPDIRRDPEKLKSEYDTQNGTVRSGTVLAVSQQENSLGLHTSVISHEPLVGISPANLYEQHIEEEHNSHEESIQEEPISRLEEIDFGSDTSGSTEDDETNNVTGLDSPGTKVWDSKSKRRDGGSHIRHPLESSEGHLMKRVGKGHIHFHKPIKTISSKRKSRLSSHKLETWQEGERTSFLLGDGLDILNASKEEVRTGELSDDLEDDSWNNTPSGAAASTSASSASNSVRSYNVSTKCSENSELANPFFKLRCEVLGANIVKSGSKTFAVYSISVTDADNNAWTIKRRFRHFEELHRRLKEFSEYNLSLPPKHFLLSGLDMPVVQERCKLLDRYLKNILHLPNVSRSIEVWDFLSVDSQTYLFSNSLSIIETFSVDLGEKPYDNSRNDKDNVDDKLHQVPVRGDCPDTQTMDLTVQMECSRFLDDSKSKARDVRQRSERNHRRQAANELDSDSDSGIQNLPSRKSDKASANISENSEVAPESASDLIIPTEWVPPNLSVPILDLVDVVFQLQDGGWIRRQAFWVAKQVLQLGMGDAFDDWLIEKIQLLRKGSVIASGIKRIEQILWPDGIFITKHPKRQRPSLPGNSSPRLNASGQNALSASEKLVKMKRVNPTLTEEQLMEAARRAKFVRELMIDNAPAALVSLVGHKEYERCAKDVYFFIQSAVCMKQLAYNLLELVIQAAFPELHDDISLCHTQKERFGDVEED
ncbi:Sorting nexin-16 [Nymphaea thermarum]|nr:Sorting nexin-16 [Nymphaea thermarum]